MNTEEQFQQTSKELKEVHFSRTTQIFTLCAFFFGGYITALILPPSPEPARINPPKAQTEVCSIYTVLKGMHYVIWENKKTGDITVVNTTIDSVKLKMFKDQIR